MEQVKIQSSRLFVTSVVENKDDLEEKFERSYQFVQNLTSGLSEKDAHDALNNALLKEKGHEDVSMGLLVSILTEPQNAVKSYRDLTLLTRDGLGLVLTHLSQLVLDRYLRFNDIAKTQLLWLVREMIKNSVNGVDNLCWNLMRHAAGGDTSQKNISLIDSLLDVYVEFKNWLERFPVLLALVVYTYLRLIEDHNAPYLQSLRQKEVNFVIGVLRDKFFDCLVIGRDLVRLLQNVGRIPEFEQLWKDMLLTPKTLSPSFTGILQLLQTRTSRRFLQSRLTPEMERKLVFLTSQVRFGNHKRYQEWFQRQYLSTPEAQSLRSDMIRFIVGVIHPTNELLCSDIIPRWAVIGWLLTTSTSPVATSNAKLALFYDWLFYESDKDNIMNIEPAILVMYHSLRSHPPVSATLLDFLCRIITNFHPPLTDKVRSGIFSSLRQILDKRVLPTLLPLFDNAKLDRDLRVMVRDTFKEFCNATANDSLMRIDDEGINKNKLEDGDAVLTSRLNNTINNHILDTEPAFSDEDDELGITIHAPEEDTDDDDIPLAKVRLKEKTQDKCEDQLPEGPLKASINRLQTETIRERRCEAMDSVIQQVLVLDSESEMVPIVSKCLCNTLQEDCKSEIFPKTVNEQTLSESIKSPLFVLFRTLYTYYKQDNGDKRLILKVLSEMYSVQPNLGYLLLYFLKIQVRTDNLKEDYSKNNALKISVYKEFCSSVEKKLDMCLYDDINACHISDNNLMMWIVPDIFKDFKPQTINNAQIVQVIVSTIDAKQLRELLYLIFRGHLVMFKTDNLISLLKTSLTWETIEQFFLWQLVQGHNFSLEIIVPLVPYLDETKHAEAVTAVMLMLRQEQPTTDSVKYLFSRDVRENDSFVFTIVKSWCDDYLDKVGDLIYNLLSTRYPSTSPNKRKRSGNKSLNTTVPSPDQVLGHLDQIRILFDVHDSLTFFNLDSLQRGLQLAHSNGSDSHKKQFGDLFAVIEEEETLVNKNRGPGRGRKAVKGKRPVTKEISDTSEESSEEEEIVKPKHSKKRKKVMSDSD